MLLMRITRGGGGDVSRMWGRGSHGLDSFVTSLIWASPFSCVSCINIKLIQVSKSDIKKMFKYHIT